MEGIVAVAFLVGCTGSLLVCEDLPAPPNRFADMAGCRAALPALVRRHERQESGLPVVMGRFQLMLRPAPAMLPPDRGCSPAPCGDRAHRFSRQCEADHNSE
jgi:hypothetical protein